VTAVYTSTTEPSQEDVLNALIAWNPDVANVNNFLNNALNHGADLASLAQEALVNAMDEPTQLGFSACSKDPYEHTSFFHLLRRLSQIMEVPCLTEY
jgi:hypothetical protein